MFLKLLNPLVILDLETTGVNVVRDRIVEMAFIKLMPNGDRIDFCQKVNPEIEIPVEASLIHGLYKEDVKNCPTFKDLATELLSFLNGADLAGFNLMSFDIPILVESFLRVDINFKSNNCKIVDVRKIFHLMEKRNLKAAYKFYCNKDLQEEHRALCDAEATLEVLIEQMKKYENQSVVDDSGNVIGVMKNDGQSMYDASNRNMVDLAGKMVLDDNNLPIFNFGKHKGKIVTEVIKDEPTYIDWMLENSFPRESKQKLIEIKTEYFNV